MSKKHKKLNVKRVGEIMDELDSPHREFDLTEAFQRNGAGAPPGPKASQPMLDAFRNTYEPVISEHLAQEVFTIGRLREYFQAWIIPKMPDPLPVYIEELDYMGFPMRTSFDGSPCILVRYRGAMNVRAEEVKPLDATPEDLSLVGISPEELTPAEVMVYTDDWKDDLSDLPPFELEINS